MTRATIRRIGNSLGIVIPKEETERQNLREGDRVDVRLEKSATLAEMEGLLRGQLGSIDALMREIDEGEDA